jgi:hypothetical protein
MSAVSWSSALITANAAKKTKQQLIAMRLKKKSTIHPPEKLVKTVKFVIVRFLEQNTIYYNIRSK